MSKAANDARRPEPGPNTEKFLREAFAGESQANRKYSAFAAKADKEGFAQAAKLFRAAAAVFHGNISILSFGYINN